MSDSPLLDLFNGYRGRAPQPSQAPQAQIALQPLSSLVVVSGYILHPETYKIEPSQIKPGGCTLTVKDGPKLPVTVHAFFEERESGKDPPELWTQVFTMMPAALGPGIAVPVFVVLEVLRVEYERVPISV